MQCGLGNVWRGFLGAAGPVVVAWRVEGTPFYISLRSRRGYKGCGKVFI